MSILQVSLFGRVRVAHGDWSHEVKVTRTIQALLAYLLLQRHRTHTRDVLATLLWGEQSQEKARGSLNTTLWRLRNVLEPEGIPAGTYLLSDHIGEVGFNRGSQYWLDVDIFETQINNTLLIPLHLITPSEILMLQNALRLYQGDLLEGFYEDWALRERERQRSLYLDCLGYLLQYHKSHGVYQKGLAYGQQILELDPLREEIHREMMQLYAYNGQRSLALRQYQVLQKILKAELGIQPMSESQALCSQIASGSLDPKGTINHDVKSNYEETYQQLINMLETIELARSQLLQTIHRVESLADANKMSQPPPF